MIERRWQLWRRRPDSAAADSPKTLVIVIVIVIVVGNTHSAGSANGVSDLVGPLEGEWNWWVLLIGIVGHMTWWLWWWWWCCNLGIGNIGSFGHIGECMNSRIGMSDHRLVEFEMGHRKKLVAVVVGIGCSHKNTQRTHGGQK